MRAANAPPLSALPPKHRLSRSRIVREGDLADGHCLSAQIRAACGRNDSQRAMSWPPSACSPARFRPEWTRRLRRTHPSNQSAGPFRTVARVSRPAASAPQPTFLAAPLFPVRPCCDSLGAVGYGGSDAIAVFAPVGFGDLALFHPPHTDSVGVCARITALHTSPSCWGTVGAALRRRRILHSRPVPIPTSTA